MDFPTFFPHRPFASANLPLTLMTLDDWVLISVSGRDSEKYLQGQVTANVTCMTNDQYLMVAHCNSKGRIWSNMYLFRNNEGFSFITRRSVCDLQINELKKYAIFSKVEFSFSERTILLLGIAGFQAKLILSKLFKVVPNMQKPLVNDDLTFLLWFRYPTERFLLVIDEIAAQKVIKSLYKKALFNNSQQWLALDIEAGMPIIDIGNSGKFIPQAVNLQALGGISFNKGCYIGQEVIARAKFRGINKRSLWYLTSRITNENIIPEIGEDIELKIGNNWRRIGTILASVQLNDNQLSIQAVMNNDVNENSVLRVRGSPNILNIKPLPYSVESIAS